MSATDPVEPLGGGRAAAPPSRGSNPWLKWGVGIPALALIVGIFGWLWFTQEKGPKAPPVAPATKISRYGGITPPEDAPKPKTPAPAEPMVALVNPSSVEAGADETVITLRGSALEGVTAVQAEGAGISFTPPEISPDGRQIKVRAHAPKAAPLGSYRLIVKVGAGEVKFDNPSLATIAILAAAVATPPAPTPMFGGTPPPPEPRVTVTAAGPVPTPAKAGPSGEPKIDPVLARRLTPQLGSTGGGEGGNAGGAKAGAGGEGEKGGGVDLSTTKIELVKARRLGDMTLTLPAGTEIPCVMDNAISTDQAGFVSCTMSGDAYGADGTVVLLDRGSQITGEYKPISISYGKARVFVVWGRVRTPTGVVVDINSPGTGPLGEAGFGGYVNNHYWERVGVPVLMSSVSFAIQAGITNLSNQLSGNNSNNGNSNNSSQNFNQIGQTADNSLQGVFAEFAKIKPTLTKNQGDLVNVMVMRDLDLSGVYALVRKGSE